MPSKLYDAYQKLESLKGKQLAVVLVIVFVVFTAIGLTVGYFIPRNLTENEVITTTVPQNVPVSKDTSYEGKVVYVDPRSYPQDKVSYYLKDVAADKRIILLSANDEKLSVVEGLEVTVFGKVKDSADGKEKILVVDRVIVKNK